MNLTQLEYETACMLCGIVYDKKKREKLNINHKIETFGGLRAIILELEDVEYITFSGTNGFLAVNDWIANLKIGLGIRPYQYMDALEFVSKHVNKDKRTIITGHSLGGFLSSCVTANVSHNNLVSVNFNPAGGRHIVKPKTNVLYEDNIYNFVTSRDILFRLTSILPFNWMKYVGETTIIADDESWNGIKSHGNWNVFKKFKL